MASYDCLRWSVGFISIVSMLIGIVGLAAGGAILNKNDLSALAIQDFIAITLLALGGAFFLAGISGCVGAKWKSTCCGVSFSIIFSLLSLILVAVGVAALIYSGKFNDQISGEKCRTGLFEDANKGADKAFELFCSADCDCDLDYAEYPSLTSMNKDAAFYVPSTTSANSVEKCPNYDAWTNEGDNDYVDDNLDFFKDIEKEFHCSGVCTFYPYYLFSGVDHTPAPTKSCSQGIADKVKDLARPFGIGAIIVGAIFFIFSICGYCMSCHPDRKDHHNFV